MSSLLLLEDFFFDCDCLLFDICFDICCCCCESLLAGLLPFPVMIVLAEEPTLDVVVAVAVVEATVTGIPEGGGDKEEATKFQFFLPALSPLGPHTIKSPGAAAAAAADSSSAFLPLFLLDVIGAWEYIVLFYYV